MPNSYTFEMEIGGNIKGIFVRRVEELGDKDGGDIYV